jgi:acetyl-CoA carboxylase biotin carboxyl carrier protein
MMGSKLPALVQTNDTDRTQILSPSVGWWSAMPKIGDVVGPGSQIGVLCRLRQQFKLVLPEGISGRVVDGLPAHKIEGVEYGQALFRIAPLSLGESPGENSQTVAGTTATAGIAEGCWAVPAPTDGIFYHRPAPDADPFVKVGMHVNVGQPIGLIEVMKTFNQISYGGQGLPAKVEIVEIACGDGSEVQANETLIVVRER